MIARLEIPAEFKLALEQNPDLTKYVRKLQRSSLRDSLSGLLNSNQFRLFLKREFRLAKRHNNTLSLILLDIDNFKSYNDKYGHIEGDKVIKGVGRIMKRKIRGTDYIFRYGYGEEFAVILSRTSLEGAKKVAEKLRDGVEKYKFNDWVTVSVGVQTYSDGRKMDYSKLLRLADKQLYRAKQEGKNRVCAN